MRKLEFKIEGHDNVKVTINNHLIGTQFFYESDIGNLRFDIPLPSGNWEIYTTNGGIGNIITLIDLEYEKENSNL